MTYIINVTHILSDKTLNNKVFLWETIGCLFKP